MDNEIIITQVAEKPFDIKDVSKLMLSLTTAAIIFLFVYTIGLEFYAYLVIVPLVIFELYKIIVKMKTAPSIYCYSIDQEKQVLRRETQQGRNVEIMEFFIGNISSVELVKKTNEYILAFGYSNGNDKYFDSVQDYNSGLKLVESIREFLSKKSQ